MLEWRGKQVLDARTVREMQSPYVVMPGVSSYSELMGRKELRR